MKKYDIHPQLKILRFVRIKTYSSFKRQLSNLVFNISMLFVLFHWNIRSKKYRISGYQSDLISVKIYQRKKDVSKRTPIIIYFHGGGFQSEGTAVHIKMIVDIVKKTKYKALYVKYRLMPKFPFPYGLEDCYSALQWVSKNQEKLGITDEIYVMGESAGGNLSAAVSLLSRDRKGPKITKQLLMYPVISQKQDTESIKEFVDAPMWNSYLNQEMWKNYLAAGDHGMLQYASIDLSSAHDLPPTYIETAELDCLRDEALQYKVKLEAAHVPVVHFQTPGTVHGYDSVRRAPIVKDLYRKRIHFLLEK